MNKHKIELVLLFVILLVNLFFIVYLLGFRTSGFFVQNNQDSPENFVNESMILADNNSVIFYIDNASLLRFENTGSMIPTISENFTGVTIKPKLEGQIKVGDIITFRKNGSLIVHRVIEKSSDDLGVYFVPKGDNNNVDDGKIRFNDIDSIVVAIIY